MGAPKISFAVLVATWWCFAGVSAATPGPRVAPNATSSPPIYAGYPAVCFECKGAPAFAREHSREIRNALRSVAPADRRNVRYTLAYLSAWYPKVFVVFLDSGPPGTYYKILNFKANYDSTTNTIVPQPP